MDELTTFDPVKLSQPVLRAITVQGVGEVRYGDLTMGDYLDLRKMPTETEDDAYNQGLEMTFRMLVKAYPELRREQVLAWPPKTLVAVSEALLSTEDFRGPR